MGTSRRPEPPGGRQGLPRALAAAIFEDVPLAIHVVDGDGTVMAWNPACERLFGWKADEVVGRPSPETPEREADDAPMLWQMVMRGNPVSVREARRRHRDGHEIDVSFSAAPLRDEAGHVAAAVVFTADITDRKTAEDALQVGEAYFRALVECSSDIITVLDADGAWRFSSDGGTRMLGWPAGYRPEGGIFALLHPDDVDVALGAFGDVLEGRRGPDTPVEFRIGATDGTWHWLETIARDLRDDPAVRGIVLNSRDVCDRRRLEEELQARVAVEDVLSGIAVRIASALRGEEDACIADALNRIGTVAGADCCYLALVSDDETTASVAHEWRAEGIEPSGGVGRELPLDACAWCTARLHSGEGVEVTETRCHLPKPDTKRSLLQTRGVRSGLVVPLESAGHLVACLGLEAVHEEREWPDGTERLLRSAGAAIVSALERRRAETLVTDQARILEMIARGDTLPAVLTELCGVVESHASGARCSLLLVDSERGVLRHAAAPGLPDAYVEAVAEVPIGPRVGTCGSAAALGTPVITEDIATDPRWDDYREVALAAGLRACWSTPIQAAADRRVLGTFALYYERPGAPPVRHRRVVDLMVQLAAVAIEHHEFDRVLAHRADHDPLTDLPNRGLFLELLAHALARAPRSGSIPAVLFLDLDDFKLVNDSFGHEAGDRLLVAVAQRLRPVVRPGDTIARFGGDEFTILCEDLDRDRATKQATEVADRLLAALDTRFHVAGEAVTVRASVGVAVADGPDLTAEELLRRGDKAMYAAKAAGRERWHVYGAISSGSGESLPASCDAM